MQRRAIPTLLFAIFIAAACQPALEYSPLEGAWMMIDATYTDADTSITVNYNQMKLLSHGHFAFGRQSAEGAYAGGGRYEYDAAAGTYTEHIEYHEDSEVVNTTVVFNCELEGDSLWYHTGDVGNGITLREVWRRVD